MYVGVFEFNHTDISLVVRVAMPADEKREQ